MDELTKIALVGTSKAGASPASESHHPADALFGSEAGSAEETLLLRAGVRAVYRQAGQVGDTSHSAIAPSPPDSKSRGSVRLAGLLENAFTTDSKDLLSEILRQMAGGDVLLPCEVLPLALNAVDAELREQLLPVLGERGRWLSDFHPDWSWARNGAATLGEKDREERTRDWEEGTIRERCQVLTTMRRSDPAEARRWLEPALPKEKAEHRARLVAVLETGLSDADQAFLEAQLDDRSQQVKEVAGKLLALLPQSELAGRMRDRAEAMMSGETKGLLRKRLKLVCEPPEEIDASWERDGISGKPPAGVGKRAFWAESVASCVPPSHWTRKFDSEPESLLEATSDDPFEIALLQGWTFAAARFVARDADSRAWLAPLWKHWADKAGRLEDKGRDRAVQNLRVLLPTMEQDTAESAVLALIEDKSTDVYSLSLLDLLPRPWSAGFSQKYLALARGVLDSSTDNRGYQWGNTLLTAARAIPRESFADALSAWPLQADPTAGQSRWAERETERFHEIIRMRQSLYEELNQSHPSSP
jgi:hypothetical protein